jgi:flagellar hook-associated protein 3 FlgL
MISNLNAANSQFLALVNANKARMNAAQLQLASGLKINNASDAPDQISALLTARAGLATTQTINQNLGSIKTEVDAAETALEQAGTAIQNAQVAGTQGANSNTTAATRSQLADQVGAAIEQLVGIANTSVSGRYIFSGDSDQTQPYTVDLTQANPISNYQGSAAATRQAQHPNGSTFAVAETAQQIFDAPSASDNVFSSLVALRTALQNNDTTGITSALGTLGTASSYFQGQLAFYGNVQNKVANATSAGQSLALSQQTQISGIEDADATQAILELNQAQLAQTAALQSKANIPTTSLFDFLK